jgi:hypothetical protein
MSGCEKDRNKRKVNLRITATENLKKARAIKLALLNSVVVEAILEPIPVVVEAVIVPTLVPDLPQPTIVPILPEPTLVPVFHEPAYVCMECGSQNIFDTTLLDISHLQSFDKVHLYRDAKYNGDYKTVLEMLPREAISGLCSALVNEARKRNVVGNTVMTPEQLQAKVYAMDSKKIIQYLVRIERARYDHRLS